MPGVIGVRSRHGLSFGDLVHVVLGPDAGFPESQPLDEWKGDVALVDARSLPPEVRKEAGIQLPEEELAELGAHDWEMADLGLSSYFDSWGDERTLAALAVEQRARLTPLDEKACRVLTALGHPWWLAGYTRHSSTLWAHRRGGPAPLESWVQRWDDLYASAVGEVPPGWLPRQRYQELWSVRWGDRVLQALSDGAVTEPGLLFARGHGLLDELVEDDVVPAALEAAARMSAGAEEVVVPLHGPARKVRLPAFVVHAWELHPLDARGDGPWPRHEVHVPAEDAWVLVKDLG